MSAAVAVQLKCLHTETQFLICYTALLALQPFGIKIHPVLPFDISLVDHVNVCNS